MPTPVRRGGHEVDGHLACPRRQPSVSMAPALTDCHGSPRRSPRPPRFNPNHQSRGQKRQVPRPSAIAIITPALPCARSLTFQLFTAIAPAAVLSRARRAQRPKFNTFCPRRFAKQPSLPGPTAKSAGQNSLVLSQKLGPRHFGQKPAEGDELKAERGKRKAVV